MISLDFVRLQTVLFFSSLNFSSKLDLAVTFRNASEGVFDTDPVILPIPENVPSVFPIMILKGRNNLWSYQIAQNRFEFVYELPIDKFGTAAFEEITETHINIGKNIWADLQTKYEGAGNRIGMVSTFANFGDNLTDVLRANFVKPSNAPEPHELQLHALHKLRWGQTRINRWTRCFAGPSHSDTMKASNLLRVEIDFNTVPEEPFNLTVESLEWFMRTVQEQVPRVNDFLFSDTSEERIF